MKILIVEDDATLAEVLKNSLEARSYVVDIARDGGEGSFLGKSYEYDAIILDYSLPKKDGLKVCKDIRSAGKNTPILFLSATDDVKIKVAALDDGADDYLVKPFSFEELQARLNALHRRPAAVERQKYVVDDLTLDLEKHTVSRDGETIQLTRKEFGVLEYLMRHPGILVSRINIMEQVWTADSELLSNAIETHIRNLRRKLNTRGKPNLIRNIPGQGYILEKRS